MKVKYIIPLLLILMIATIACENDDSGIPEIESTDYFPLNIGDTWEYEDHIRKVTASEIINGKEYRIITHETYRADTLYYTYDTYFRTTDEGRVYKLNSNQSDEYLFADFDRNEDDTWTYIDKSNHDSEWIVTVLSEITFEFANVNLENCKRFFYNAPAWADEEHTLVFSPGIGEIHSFSDAWGIGQTVQSATINGIEYQFK